MTMKPMSLLEQMVAEWGTQCPDYHNTCALCVAWRMFRNLNRVPTLYEVEDELDRIRENDEE
jgi:hypothetical protein